MASKEASSITSIDLGDRPLELLAALPEGDLKQRLTECQQRPPERTRFSIAHRGAPLRLPEHTRESYLAAVRQGAGLLECDVTFTKDKQLVCRHSQCDLHSTTDILTTPLAETCRNPFMPAQFSGGKLRSPATAKCCTSELSLQDFKSLRGRMDNVNSRAINVSEYLQMEEAEPVYGELLSHRESIALFDSLGVDMIPELKEPLTDMPFNGYTRQDYAEQLIQEYRDMGIAPERVWPQSFHLEDVSYWLKSAPDFADQVVFLDGRYNHPGFDQRNPIDLNPDMHSLAESGVQIIAPPLWILLALEDDQIAASPYARAAQRAGLDIMSWTLERSGSLTNGGGWYYQSITPAIQHEGAVFEVLHVLANEVGVLGVFSDWPATVTFYANCFNAQSHVPDGSPAGTDGI
ncbi:MAG: glycerophosphodiester phosphodiesterase family protein [Pseudomonadota bacterium]